MVVCFLVWLLYVLLVVVPFDEFEFSLLHGCLDLFVGLFVWLILFVVCL